MRLPTRGAALLMVTGLLLGEVGCGGGGCGGGGGGGGAIQVTFTPASLAAAALTGSSASIPLTATINPEPTTVAYPVIEEDAPILTPGPIVVSRVSPGVYQATLGSDPALSVGDHRGTLRLRICKDSQCASEYALIGATVPIAVTIEPHLLATVTVGSSTATVLAPYGLGSDLPYSSGQGVSIVTNVPATFARGSSMGGADIEPTTVTSTSWAGTLSGTSTEWVGIMISSARIPMNAVQVLFDIQ